jgi:hypothetical protein
VDAILAGAQMGNQNAAGPHKHEGWVHRDYYGNRRHITKEDLAAHNAGREEPTFNENYNAAKKLGTTQGRAALKILNKWENKVPHAKVAIEKLDKEHRAASVYDEHDAKKSAETAAKASQPRTAADILKK